MEIRKSRDLGRLIRARRRQLGWSQSALAARVHTTRRWISEVENGKPTAEIGLVLAALQTLGITLGVEPKTLGPLSARSRPMRPPQSQPGVPELTDLLQQHIDSSAPGTRRVWFSRKHR